MVTYSSKGGASELAAVPPSWFVHLPIDTSPRRLTQCGKRAPQGNEREEAPLAELKVLSEIPGKVVSIDVEPGEEVEEDDTLIMLESMKMEIPVDCPEDGTVVKILVAVDDMVEEGDEIAIIET